MVNDDNEIQLKKIVPLDDCGELQPQILGEFPFKILCSLENVEL